MGLRFIILTDIRHHNISRNQHVQDNLRARWVLSHAAVKIN